MKIGIPKEIFPGERRVATTPEIVEQIKKLGFEVIVETGAGIGADLADEVYVEAGAEICPDAASLWSQSDIVLKVRPPAHNVELNGHEASLLKPNATLISFIWPAQNEALIDSLAARDATVISMDSVPRISRAQKLDALSSMANIAGYRAVIEAANHFGRFFTGQVTAAGKVPPAKVFVIGAGVAGLAAIGTASGLGAIVRATDTRPEVADQVASMGAEFVPVEYEEDGSSSDGYARVMSAGFQQAQREMIARQCMDVDIVITTALIPGKPAPKLISAGMVETMKPGSVIVDLAAEQGGNCELTAPGEVVHQHGVGIVGYTDLPSRMARQSSQLYATNLLRLLQELCPDKDGIVSVDMDDEMIRGATVIKDGQVSWPPPPIKVAAAAPKPAPTSVPLPAEKRPLLSKTQRVGIVAAALGLLFYWIGANAPADFLSHFTVFVLACFVGYMVIWNVTPALHTPLMSVTNAISSIIAIGALLQIGAPGTLISVLAGFALMLTAINMFGGFAVTQRMLQMFRKSDTRHE